MTVTEAARRGTPAVGYDIPGFRDSIDHDRTGLLTRPEPRALAAGLRRILGDARLHARLREAAFHRSLDLSFDATAAFCEASIMRACT